MAEDDLMTTAQVAAQLGVARQTVDRWIRLRRLRARRIKVGKRAIYRVRRADFADFVRRYVSDDW